MKSTAIQIQRIYLLLLFLNTLASSLIWGINTLFLLEAGLSNTQAFLANAFFTIGQVVFEVPTGMVADLKGRRASYLLGTLTLSFSTLIYLLAWSIHAPMWLWAIASMLLGLGFTFFSGATEAWLVDALTFTKHKGTLDSVFAKGQVISGVAMLAGSLGGGLLAQVTHLGVPYIVRAGLLSLNFMIAYIWMNDLGFTPQKRTTIVGDVKLLLQTSIKFGFNRPAIRWIMLSTPFISGVSFYAFYAMQPYLLELYDNDKAYAIAGLAAAIVAGAQIVGGLISSRMHRVFKLRTSLLLFAALLGAICLGLLGVIHSFWMAIVVLCIWGLVGAVALPVRQAYLNGLIPTNQRATVLSFDSLFGSMGGVIIQPLLGRIADTQSYANSFIGGGVLQGFSLPFLWKAKKERVPSDLLKE